jgi:hypothetical protein
LTVPTSLTRALCDYLVARDEARGRTCGEAGEYLSSASLNSSYFRQMRANGWYAELTLTVRLRFLTHSRGETFDRAAPLYIRFPREAIPPRAVEAQIEELDVAERV